jgi:hypothetical protein
MLPDAKLPWTVRLLPPPLRSHAKQITLSSCSSAHAGDSGLDPGRLHHCGVSRVSVESNKASADFAHRWRH